MRPRAGVAQQYADFAAAAREESACFHDWARGVLGDPEMTAWIGRLPDLKRQPNLVFAAARWHGVPAPGPYTGLRDALLGDDGSIVETILSRSTQTNEVGRLATLLPAFARIASESGRPLALVEAGASAGLCLYPDCYGYRWTIRGLRSERSETRGLRSERSERLETRLPGPPGAPVLECAVTGPFKAPDQLPAVAHRGGVDLNPLSVTDPDQMAWLATLVWPEHEHRRERLERAIAIAADDPPDIRAGDLLSDLPAVVERAAEHGQVVVFHSAVIAYLTDRQRAEFDALMRGLVRAGACRWVSNEGHRVLRSVTRTGRLVPHDQMTFVLGLDGEAIAWTHGHGASMTWL